MSVGVLRAGAEHGGRGQGALARLCASSDAQRGAQRVAMSAQSARVPQLFQISSSGRGRRGDWGPA
eukprot:14146904-Alexandrium_andersonii.AAC.1